MKTWIKRTVIGVVSTSALLCGIVAFAENAPMRHGWQTMSPEDAAAMKAKVIARIGSKLDLDEAQKARLGVLADSIRTQHEALVGSGANPRADLQSLIAGSVFDRNKATAMIEAKQTAVTLKSPAVVAAMADFYDSLRADQQAKVREFLAAHRGAAMRHHD